MRPETHVGSHPIKGSPTGQKPPKLSGLTDNSEGMDVGGFLALLANQGPELQPIEGAPIAVSSDALGNSSVTDRNTGESFATTGGKGAIAGDVSPIDLTFLLSQSGSVRPTAQLEQLRTSPPTLEGRLPDAEVVSKAAGSEGLPLDRLKNAADGLGDPSTPRLVLRPGDGYLPAADFSMAPLAGRSTAISQVPTTDLAGDKAGSTGKDSNQPSDAVGQLKAQEQRVLKLSGDAGNFVSRMPSVDPILVRSFADSDLRQMERQLIKPQMAPTGIATENTFGSQVQFSGDMLGPTSAAINVEGSQPEVYVAAQVNYWISQDVQNAELKLNGFDDLPIDVHISLQGNDAQVDFRTDHAEIRDILRAAESHLKDMLAREGLVLSGVSVGTSRRDEQGQGRQQEPSSARQRTVVAEEQLPLTGVSRPVPRSGGAIDVFV